MKFLLFLIAIASAQQQCLDSADTYINKRCFKLVNQPMSWQDARNWCHYRNPVTSSYLATVIDKTTANFLASIARTAFNINDGLFWIGLSRYNSSSRWQWDDGTPFVWSNFDANNNQNLNYAAESITNGKWVTKYGDEKYNFVCSYDPNAQPGTTGTPGTASWGTTVPIEQTTENDWTTTSDGPTPTEYVASSTSSAPLCSTPYTGKIATLIELNAVQAEISNVVTFTSSNLYNSANYDFTGPTQAINVPYGSTDNYLPDIFQYGDAKSLGDLQANIDIMFQNSVLTTNPEVDDGLQFLIDYTEPLTTGTNEVIIVAGNHNDTNYGLTSQDLFALRQQGYKVISVAVGTNHGDLSLIADKPEWYVQVDATNGQSVANQISYILCNL